MKAPLRAIFLVGALLFPSALAAQTDSYPSKPIRIVVAFTAGGTTDIIARLVGKKMTDAWGQPVVIDNRPGAGGNLGSNIVANISCICPPSRSVTAAAPRYGMWTKSIFACSLSNSPDRWPVVPFPVEP
jgi:hypothetical protein